MDQRRLQLPSVFTAGALLAIFALAIWLRMQLIIIFGGTEEYLQWAMKNYFGGITPGYLNLARDILEKGTYASLAYPPGYPLLIAGFNAIGIVDPQQLRLAQIVIDSTGILAFFILLRAAHAERSIALVGAFFYATYPLFAAGSTFILAESLSPALMLWCMVTLVWAAQSSKTITWGFAGLLIGTAGLIRPDFLLFIGIAVLWAFLTGKKVGKCRAIIALVIGFALPVGSWGVHNRLQHDVWLFSTTGGGVGLWEGLGALPNNYGYVLSDEYALRMLQTKGLRWHSVEANQYLKQEYFRAWREHPSYVLKVILYRWEKILFTSEEFQSKSFVPLQKFLDQYGIWITLIALCLFWRNPFSLLLIAGPIIYALFSIGLVHWEPRYVRYVHIGYLSAVLLPLSWILSLPVIRKRPTLVWIGSAVILAGAIKLTFPSIDKTIERREQLELAAHLSSQLAKGNLKSGPKLNDLKWFGIGNASYKVTDNQIAVITTTNAFEYQAAAVIPTKAIGAMLITYSLDIEAGGATVGIISEKGEWLAQSSAVTTGPHHGTLKVGITPNKEVTLVLANNNPGGISRFTVKDLRILVSER